MLQNELLGLERLKEELLTVTQSGSTHDGFINDWPGSLSMEHKRIRNKWDAAAFSAAADHRLKRYFSFHLNGIRQLLDTIQNCYSPCNERYSLLNNELLSLVNYLHCRFDGYFDGHTVAPAAYKKHFLHKLSGQLMQLKTKLAKHNFDRPLKKSILTYLGQIEGNGSVSFNSLFFLEKLTTELLNFDFNGSLAEADKQLAEKLVQLNFNHLGIFTCLQDQIRGSLNGLDRQLQLEQLKSWSRICSFNPGDGLTYNYEWPPLCQMLTGWISEETSAVQKQVSEANKASLCLLRKKLSLNISVAQLACLLRLFFEEQLINHLNLTAVFRFFCNNYSTKRQQVISPGSLSKEFYSTSQVTAAVVRDMLQKMIVRINQHFFPVLAVIGTAIGACSGIH